MGCGCGKKKTSSGVKPNGKLCPNCGWLLNRVHKYDGAKKKVDKYWACSNKAYKNGTCNYREPIT